MAEIPYRRSPHPEIEARIHAALASRRAAERQERPDRGLGLYLGELGSCARKLWAQMHGHPREDFDGSALVRFGMGSAAEDLVVGWLVAAGYTIRRQQGRVLMQLDGDRAVSGHIDGEIWLEHNRFDVEPAILEIKSANAEQFALCEAHGYDRWRPNYGDTIQAYMGASGVHVAMAVVLCKDNSRLYAEKLRFDPERYEGLKAKAEAVLTHETALPRPAEATSEYCQFCKWCHLRAECWGPTWDARFDP